jgi:hypothetical protein
MSSFLNQSGDLIGVEEVLPESMRMTKVSKSSLANARRNVTIVPQGPPQAGSPGAGTGAGGNTITFLIADQGGLIDPRSIRLNYWVRTSGGATTVVPDDGHPFGTVVVSLNGQPMDSMQQAAKVSNIEMKLGASKSFYQTAGSFMGWELLNDDMLTSGPPAAFAQTAPAFSKFGQATYLIGDYAARAAAAGKVATQQFAGLQRELPLGNVSGVGRIKQYLPLGLLGDLQIQLTTMQANEYLLQYANATNADYSLAGISLTYDVVQVVPEYMDLLSRAVREDAGLVVPFESSLVAVGPTITAGNTALKVTEFPVTRSTRNLLRASVVQVPTAQVSSINWPGQSCFSQAGTYSVQYRVASLVYPQVPPQGPAQLFAMSLSAYGSVVQEHGSIINRALWSQSSSPTAAATAYTATTPLVASSLTDSLVATSGKFTYADSFIPTYSWRVISGSAEPLGVDGLDVASATGSQIIVSITSAPDVDYTPFVVTTALRFLEARQGMVNIRGG